MSRTEIPKTYNPGSVETRIYEEWERAGAFDADPNPEKPPYCIVVPPSNVTGALHMGHALNGSIQDTLIRRARMKGFEALWLPGVDHASIAVQNVVERKLLREEGKSRFDLGREEFVERCREFALKTREQILSQYRRLGASLDWRRLRYTMDDEYVDAVLTAFIRLYEEGLIYRGNRITNWCPHDRSAISDLEVNYEDIDGKLYGIRYPFVDGKGPGSDGEDFVQVFSTRPETMLGDVALVVHPDDERHKDLVGRRVEVPFVEREVEVFADDYVDPNFGTGILKVTPAHDPNDFEIGERLGLAPVNIMNADGTINENGGPFTGLSREEARKAVVGRLEERELLGPVRDYRFRIGTCDRCGTVIEPWLSEQWWCSMKPLAEPGVEVLREGGIKVYPDSWRRETMRWLENIRDWNVSRQLWWGQRIPVWYGPDSEVVASKESPGEDFEQDPDVFDTWFSSSLWPIATLGWPNEDAGDLHYFYPTSLLSTAREIMYLWVARMIMTGLRYRGRGAFQEDKRPLHRARVRRWHQDEQAPKGNVDRSRSTSSTSTARTRSASGCLYQSSTQDFPLLPRPRRPWAEAFVTKLWNAMRFVASFLELRTRIVKMASRRSSLSIGSLDPLFIRPSQPATTIRLARRVRVLRGNAPHLRLRLARVRRLVHRDSEGCALARHAACTEGGLHWNTPAPAPVMPFATEEMARILGQDELLIRQRFPELDPSLEDDRAERTLERTRRAISAVRAFRGESRLDGELEGRVPEGVDQDVYVTLAGVKPLQDLDGSHKATLPAGDIVVEVSLTEELRQGEISRLRKEMDRVEGEVKRARGKLANEKFVERAPVEVVEGEREKLDVNTRMLETLSQRLGEYL